VSQLDGHTEPAGHTSLIEQTQPLPRPNAARWWRVLGVWALQEFRLLIREPVAVFFSMAFPLVIYIFIGIPYGSEEVDEGIYFIDVMYSALIMTVVSNLLLMGLPIYLAELRSRGANRRYAILPLPGWILAAAVLAAMLALVIAATAVIVTVVALRDGLLPAATSPLFLALAIGGIVWLSAVGLLIGSLPLSPRTTQALSAVVFFTMFFGSGAAVPLEGLPTTLQTILDWNPHMQWLDVMVGVYTGTGVEAYEWWRLLTAVPLTVLGVGLGLRMWRRH